MFKSITEHIEDVQSALAHTSAIVEDALKSLYEKDYEEVERSLRLIQRYVTSRECGNDGH